MKTSTRFILLIIFVLIVAGGVTAGVIFLNNNSSKSETKEELSWEEEFSNILKEKENFKELKDVKIGLCDLIGDETPELIVFGIDEINKFMAKIYSVSNKKLEEKQIILAEEFNFEYVYNIENEEEKWYIATEESNKLYEIDLEKEENIETNSNINNTGNLITIGETAKTEFVATSEETKIKEIFETIKKDYIANAEIKNTEEAKTKIQSANMLKNIKKIDATKGIVYSAREYETDNYANVIDKTFHNYYEYPAINIESEDVKAINAQIKEKYGFEKEDEEQLIYYELEVITYDYYINGNILSLIVMQGGNDSTWTSAYNVDLETGKQIPNEYLIGRAQLSSSEKFDENKIKETLKEYSIKEIDKSATEMKNTIEQYWDESYENEVTKLKEEVNKNLETLDNVYLNAEGKLCCRSRYQIFGGQFTCGKTIEIDTTNNNIKEIKFEDYLQRGIGSQN